MFLHSSDVYNVLHGIFYIPQFHKIRSLVGNNTFAENVTLHNNYIFINGNNFDWFILTILTDNRLVFQKQIMHHFISLFSLLRIFHS